MDTMVRSCALPGCGATIEHQAGRPARLYCSVEHRREARRMRAEHAHRRDPAPDADQDRPGVPTAAAVGPVAAGPDRPGTDRGGSSGTDSSASDTSASDTARSRSARPAVPGRDGPGAGPAGQVAGPVGPAMASAITHDTLVRPAPPSRAGRWRRAVLHHPAATADTVRGSPAPPRRAELIARARAPLAVGPHRVAVVSLKGGVGKTTVAAGVGLSLSEQRGDRVVAVDAAPDQGTLADRLTGPLPVGVQQLLGARDGVSSVSELSRYTGLAGRLVVVSGEQDPAAADGFHGEEHRQVTELLGRYFDILITDCGPGMMHSAAGNAVAEADTIVVVADVALDGAGRASATLDWLAAHGYPDKAADAIVALCSDRAGAVVEIEPVREHFRGRARAVVDVPHDPALVAGARIRVEDLRPRTRDSFLELGALVADGFAG